MRQTQYVYCYALLLYNTFLEMQQNFIHLVENLIFIVLSTSQLQATAATQYCRTDEKHRLCTEVGGLSSGQVTNPRNAGQIPYSKAQAMARCDLHSTYIRRICRFRESVANYDEWWTYKGGQLHSFTVHGTQHDNRWDSSRYRTDFKNYSTYERLI
jgi:hypothetical protein